MLRFNGYQGDHMQLSNDFLLDPGIHFLNHGSFGACPRPVFDVYQRWQRELEAQPVEFLGRRVGDLLQESRAALGGLPRHGARRRGLLHEPDADEHGGAQPFP